MNATSIQQQAIAARGNVLVAAGAGTGKTSTLVRRCIELLKSGASLDRILMVTFTEAAAAEMRVRIRQALTTALDDPANAERAEHLDKQLALLDGALICTLHSFCLQLVREHFDELGIDPEISILDEPQTRPVIGLLLDGLFEKHYAGAGELDSAVQQLVRLHGSGSDERIRDLILRLHRYAQSLASPDQWMRAQRTLFAAENPECWRSWFAEGVPEWGRLWIPALRQHESNPAVGKAILALHSLGASVGFQAAAAAVEQVRAADADPVNWPRGSKTAVRRPLERFFEEAAFLASLVPRTGSDPLKEDWNLVRAHMGTLLELAEEFGREYAAAKRDLGGMDFADLEQFALAVLRDGQTGAATPAAQLWRERLDYVFVDEYQDINAAQDAILSAISRDIEAANRFLVGDVKQSIYRFRLADPTIFRRYESRWTGVNLGGNDDGKRLVLNENFRSRPELLGFVNGLFATLMRPAVGGVEYEALEFGNPEGRRALVEHGGGKPRVELHVIVRSDEDASENGEARAEADSGSREIADLPATEREARLAGLRLRRLMDERHEVWDHQQQGFRPVRWSDMAVLLRSPASRVEGFAREFGRLGIPIEAARGSFFESAEVSDLVSLLKLLDNPLQDVPLLAVLHSPLFGMSVAELAEIRAWEKPEARSKFFWMAARTFHAKAPREQAAWRKLDGFFRLLERWREMARQGSVSQCLESALDETHYELLLRAKERGEQRWANVRRLLDLARNYDPCQRQGLFRFLRFIEAQEEAAVETEAAAVGRDAVRLMSIHKSKGLEFPVVLLAGLGWRFNSQDLRENILLDETFGLCPKAIAPETGQFYPTLPHWLARWRQRSELLGEELRLLYVAMTRARDTLILTGSPVKKGAGEWPPADGSIADRELLSANCPWDWLKPWLSTVTTAADWTGAREGGSSLLTWTVYDEFDARLQVTKESKNGDAGSVQVGSMLDEAVVAKLNSRLAWSYSHAAAVGQHAKTSVTELRRNRADEEALTAKFVRRDRFALPKTAARRVLSAADAGVAHHRFFERMCLSGVPDIDSLRAQALQMCGDKWITQLEMEALHFEGIAAFWKTDLGGDIWRNAGNVRRELPFTAGLAPADLIELRVASGGDLAAEELVIIQGVVDLAVILADELWIVDFKTDAVGEGDIEKKTRIYEPQLRLYALALSRIYARPVTKRCLYFVASRELKAL